MLDVRSRRRLARLRVDDSGIRASPRFSRDGRLLLAGSRDGRVRVFSARDWRPPRPGLPRPRGLGSRASTPAPTGGRSSPPARTARSASGTSPPGGRSARRCPGPQNVNVVARFTPDGDSRLRGLRRRPRLPLGRAPVGLEAPGLRGGRPPADARRMGARAARPRRTRRPAESEL